MVSLGLATLPSSIFLSATSTVVLETVVVVPFTTKFPVIVALPPTVALPLTAKLVRVPREVIFA